MHLLRADSLPYGPATSAIGPVLMGDSNLRTPSTRSLKSLTAPDASKSDLGSAEGATGQAKRPRSATNTRLFANVSRQNAPHRRSVRALTLNARHSRSSRSAVGPSLRTGSSKTKTPKNTFRPRNLKDGGVTRLRHASSAQQKLNRTACSGPSASGPPRGLRP
jgi:hypothetical protein